MVNSLSSSFCALDGVILITNRFEQQCSFYGSTLGLEQLAGYRDAAFFKVGNQKLGIFATSHHPEAVSRLGGSDHGLSHLEFGVYASELPKVTERLDAFGSRAYRDNFQDPDGNLFHFNQR